MRKRSELMKESIEYGGNADQQVSSRDKAQLSWLTSVNRCALFVEYPLFERALDGLQWFLNAGADVSWRSQKKALINSHVLFNCENAAKLRFLLTQGANPNAVDYGHDRCDHSILQFAIQRAGIDGVVALLEAGADVNYQNIRGQTPLMTAMDPSISIDGEAERLSMIRMLLEFGANLELADSEGNSALHYSMQICDIDVIDVLVQAGARIDALNLFGETPLCKAAEASAYPHQKEAALKVIEHCAVTLGANIDHRDGLLRRVDECFEEDDRAWFAALRLHCEELQPKIEVTDEDQLVGANEGVHVVNFRLKQLLK